MTPPGPWELILILLIVVLLFGAKKLPELSRSVGQSISSFKKGVREANEEPEGEEGADAGDREQAGSRERAGDGDEAGESQQSHDRGNA
jgi:sec-independent protein translocase protein TatA